MRYEDRFEDRVEGYRVVYEYRDRRGVTRLSYDPDDRIRVPSERRYRDDDDD